MNFFETTTRKRNWRRQKTLKNLVPGKEMHDEVSKNSGWEFLYSSWPFIHSGADEENLFVNQDPLKMESFPSFSWP